MDEIFLLKTCISNISERDYKAKFGEQSYEDLKANLLSSKSKCCDGCNTVFASDKSLHVHMIGKNIDDENIKNVLLCLPCHFTQHLDSCVKSGIIEFVNSKYSQAELIKKCRLGGKDQIQKEIKSRDIIVLNIDNEQYISKIKENILNNRDTIKIIFNDKFDWTNFDNFKTFQ